MKTDATSPLRKQAMCTGKVAYKSHNAARKSLGYVRHLRLGISKEHRPYQCPHCHQWHIGRSSNK